MKNAIKRKAWLLLIFLACSVISMQAEKREALQKRILTGVVLDEQGMPAIGVNVLVKGTTIGVATDIDGKYKIEIPQGNRTIVFSYIGYQTQEIAYRGQTSLNINLEPDSEILDDVVVVGYGVQKKVNLTGAVGSIEGDKLASKAVGNVTSALAGLVPGLKVMNRGGQPGADGAELNIRGFGTPLVLVDGIEQSFGFMDPNEIENISILKDASAAVYGSRAANGVILVTTKRGKKGKPKFNLNVNVGFSAPTRIIEMASSGLYAELMNEANIVNGDNPTYRPEEIEKFYAGTDPRYPNTDWRKETLKSISPKYDINMGVRGGGDKVSYFLSLGYLNQKSLLRSDDINFNRISFRSNIDAQINSVLRLSADFSGRLEYRDLPGRNMSIIMKSIQAARPIIPVYWPDSSKPTNAAYDALWANPLMISERDYSGYSDEDFSSVRGTFSVNLNFNKWIKGLSADGKFDYRLNNKFVKTFNTSFECYDYNYDANEYITTGQFNKGQNSLNEEYTKDWL